MEIKLLKYCRFIGFVASIFYSANVISFELLSEGAMGSVSAISANTAEEIVNIAGPTAAGLKVDDGYETLPFKTSVQVESSAKDEVSNEIDFALVQEVDAWVDSLGQRGEVANSTGLEVGYIDELPPSSFDESSFVIRDDEFDRVIFEPDANRNDQETTTYEIGRVEQTITKLEQKVDSVQYIVERKVDFVATIDAFISRDSPSIGSGYITNLTSISNVTIATVRE
tara:strand:+ start:3336 stop:4013 length:678 start_codon:yes stop_codon:yes gene_type:complete